MSSYYTNTRQKEIVSINYTRSRQTLQVRHGLTQVESRAYQVRRGRGEGMEVAHLGMPL